MVLVEIVGIIMVVRGGPLDSKMILNRVLR